MIPYDDRGLTLGDGLFETMLVRDGEIVLFESHLARLGAGCTALGLPWDLVDKAQAVCESAVVGVSGRAALRLTLTLGSGGRGLDRPETPEPRLFATITPIVRPNGPETLTTVSVRRNEGSPASGRKTLSYLDQVLARREAGTGEALMLNNRGEIACAAAANIFWMAGDRLFTPALECGALNGIMASMVRFVAPALGLNVQMVAAPRSALNGAQAVFLTNSLIGLRRVSSLDGVKLGEAPPEISALEEALAPFS